MILTVPLVKLFKIWISITDLLKAVKTALKVTRHIGVMLALVAAVIYVKMVSISIEPLCNAANVMVWTSGTLKTTPVMKIRTVQQMPIGLI